MARFVDPDSSRTRIDELVEVWKERCLLADGSLLFDDRAIWTATNLRDFRDRFLGNLIQGTEQNFEQKLATQLETASSDVRWLACELLAIHFLFALVAISGEGKLKVLEATVAPLWDEAPSHWERLRGAMHEGIGNPGSGYNIRRDLQVGYLIDFARRWKELGETEQSRLLEDPWALRDFADEPGDDMPVREMRHILLHLLRPDDFERISSRTHKAQIVDAFRKEFLDATENAPGDLDEQLLHIRGQLERLDAQPEAQGGILDFYWPPLRGIWDPGSQAGEGTSDIELLLYKKQLVLYGPPGTSKTHRTRKLPTRSFAEWRSSAGVRGGSLPSRQP